MHKWLLWADSAPSTLTGLSDAAHTADDAKPIGEPSPVKRECAASEISGR